MHGTTGYEFAGVVNNLFVDGRHERAMDDIYHRFLRAPRSQPSFDDLAYQSRKQVVHATMSGDINSLGHQLNRLSERNRHYRDFTLYSLIAAIKELIACFPVYRTYITAEDDPNAHDRRYITRAVRCANQRSPRSSSRVFDFIQRVLLKQTLAGSPEEREERARFIGKFQQITSPVAAKGIEDTAFYVYNRLVSLNEVGGNPTRFGLNPTAVHAWMCERQRQWPAALSTTSTHDTKRGEDMRARLNVLSEMPEAWKGAVTRWRALNRRFRADIDGVDAPDANDEYLLYQTLVGAWPFTADGQAGFSGAAQAATCSRPCARPSAAPAGSIPTTDTRPPCFGSSTTSSIARRPFLQAFLPFQARVAELGIYNSLAQLLVKITAPGVPDFYQGTELWDLSLVDPDNRQPVDYALPRADAPGHRRRVARPAPRRAGRRPRQDVRHEPRARPARDAQGHLRPRQLRSAVGGRVDAATTCSRLPGATGNRRRLRACRGLSEACSATDRSRRSAPTSGETRASCSRRRATANGRRRFATR